MNRVVHAKRFLLALPAVLLTAPTAHAQCDPADLFGPHQQFGAGSSNPFFVAIGDLDGDGVPDLVAIGSGVGVLLGNGDGTFQPPQDIDAGSAPSFVAIGDLNGNGVPDLAVANQDSSSVSVLLGNGDGTFQPRQEFDTGGAPISVAIGDLNGDGVLDLVVANSASESDSVSVLLGNGDGTFQPRQDFDTGGEFTVFVAIGDLDGDGVLDLAVLSSGLGANVSVLLGNGDGTFQIPQTFATADLDPRSVAIGDLDGDGVPDLVVVNGGSSTVSVLLGNGDGTFQPRQDFATAIPARSVAIGDLDGDGVPDLAVAIGSFIDPDGNVAGSVSVLLGNGDGTFQPRQDFVTGSMSLSVAIGDLNGDGLPDLAVVNQLPNTVSVLLNQCEQPCAPDLDGNGELNFFDIAAFLVLFQNQDPIADWNNDGLFNFFDFAAYLDAFIAGCP